MFIRDLWAHFFRAKQINGANKLSNTRMRTISADCIFYFFIFFFFLEFIFVILFQVTKTKIWK